MTGRFTAKEAEKFWARVDSSAGDESCWPWLGAIQDSGGHGRLSIRGRFYHRGRNLYAYRVAYELTTGFDMSDPSILACHSCDNPICVNPGHIFLGDHLANMSDAAAKGLLSARRCLSGEAHPAASRPDSDVDEARALFASGGWTKASLARRYGVGTTTMGRWLAMQSRVHHLQERAA